LNRLSTAQEGSRWSNNYTYDPWGNLTKKLYGSVQAGEHMDTSADTGNHLMGYSYDTGGNMTTDGVNTYAYDGENRITSVAGVSYTYDADGRRVKKSSGTNFWYGPSGEPLAETDSAGTWTNYVFFAGQRLARNVNGDIKYYITDHLHSTGMFVDKAGTSAAVLDDNDFYPWGGVVPGVGKTTSNNTVKFTGKYRDTESGLDYFGARYYANAMGRFMSPDWAAKPVTVPYAEFGDPQSLNLYGYVEDAPINRIDADGHTYAGFDGFMRPRGGMGDVPMSDVDMDGGDNNVMALGPSDAQPQAALAWALSAMAAARVFDGHPHGIFDEYHPDLKNHGAPHIDRVDKHGKLVGRYRPDGSGIPHKGKVPGPIPNKDKGKFEEAATKVRKYEAAQKMDEILEQHPLPEPGVPRALNGPANPGYSPCAGGPCDFKPILPFLTPVPGAVPEVPLPRPSVNPRFVFEEFVAG
jgi:RHS repeat-associated protein